jgi:hypothetical protein
MAGAEEMHHAVVDHRVRDQLSGLFDVRPLGCLDLLKDVADAFNELLVTFHVHLIASFGLFGMSVPQDSFTADGRRETQMKDAYEKETPGKGHPISKRGTPRRNRMSEFGYADQTIERRRLAAGQNSS